MTPPGLLFEIPFASAMSDGDLSSLVRALDFPVRIVPAASPGLRGPAPLRRARGLGLRQAGPEKGARDRGHEPSGISLTLGGECAQRRLQRRRTSAAMGI